MDNRTSLRKELLQWALAAALVAAAVVVWRVSGPSRALADDQSAASPNSGVGDCGGQQ
jgi:hypothetical protein